MLGEGLASHYVRNRVLPLSSQREGLGTVGRGWTKSYALLITVVEKLEGFGTSHEFIRSAVEAKRTFALNRDIRVFGSASTAFVVDFKPNFINSW
jgi:hypothetical protein